MRVTRTGDRARRPHEQGLSKPAGGSGPTVWQAFDDFFRQRPAVPGLALFGLVLWTFFSAIQNDFVDYDDPAYVTDNAHVLGGLTWRGIRWAFLSCEASNWHPLTWLSHMLDCELFGLQPWGHHLTSVLIHALNAWLAFLVLRQVTGSTWRSLMVAALFGLHPLRVESVAWIAERKDVLSTMFWMLTLWAYARYAKKRSKVEGREPRAAPGAGALDPLAGRSEAKTARPSTFDYGLALVLFTLGLLSKPMLVTVPLVLLLLDYWPLNRLTRQGIRPLLIEKIPFLLAALAASVVTLLVQSSSGALKTNAPLLLRSANAVVSYCRYLGKLLWPSNLAVLYPYPSRWSTAVVLVSLLVLGLISLAVLWWRRRHSYMPVGWLWFIVTLIPVIGLVQVGAQSMADRYSYVPSLGLFLLVVWGFHELTRRWRPQPFAASVFAAIILCCCIRLTFVQIGHWRSTETLFVQAIRVTRGNCVAHNNLGTVFDKAGRWEDAIREYRRALEIQPFYHLALNNLGLVLDRQGHSDEAIACFEKALRARPGYAEAHKNLGIVLGKQGRIPEAIYQFEEALKAEPGYAEAHNAWGCMLETAGELDQAMDHYRQALRLKPAFGDAHYSLGNVLARKDRLDEAIREFQEALAFRPDPDAHNNLGVALERKGLVDQAITQYVKAVELNPGFARAYFNLGVALCRQGRLEEGIRAYQEALRLKSDYAEARKNLEAALALKQGLPKPAGPEKP
jgi:tetratricopeptide (TPR) repeat protein